MKLIILSIFFVCTITTILCRPADEPIAILKSETEGVNADGSYRFAYETANDIAVEESGILKNPGTDAETLEVTGKFSYKLSDGTPIELTYIANEGGFQPSGAHLPQPPPIPDAIQRALDYIASQPQKAEGSAPKPFFAKPK
ncbi:endocuticle structural glycoprotein SgAbd-8-like [Chrysoperla carnea]|uniref:endocuticle structural glycoprotein SgAbd-8-like n=1 Tax=Chrysoperla carnea TaxID=189513 RepID=UPI001D0942EC|nr:endocuticle structural glycoprotein SgAbd-8-like [Chrysoperla carnea]